MGAFPERCGRPAKARRAWIELVCTSAVALVARSSIAQSPSPAPVPAPAPVSQPPAPATQDPPVPRPPVPPQATQDPPAQPPPAQPAPAPPPAEAPKPIDPTNAAAELLRRRLGLRPGPEGQVPNGPPDPPPAPPAASEPPAGEPVVPPTGTAPKPQEPAAGSTPPPPAATPPQEPKPAAQDPTDQAAEALRRLLRGAKPPEVAPIPGQQNPEPKAPEPRTAAAPVVPPLGVPVHGSLWLRYRARHGGGATDQDVVGRLGVDIGSASDDAVTAHLRARGFWNADGRRRDDPFPGLDHSFQDEWNGRLYAAHVDVHRQGPVDLLRLGRQDLDETPTTLQFDGARLDSVRFGGALKVWAAAYGGVPVHQFEERRRGDLVAGLAGGLQPWSGGRVRLDAMHLEDEFLAIGRQDDLLSVRWWQQLGELQLHGLHTWRDGQARDLLLGSRGELLGCQWTFDYRELVSTQRQQVTELDPFYVIGFDYSPYRQLSAVLRRDLCEGIDVGLAGDLRRLRDEGDQAAFNREFERLTVDAAWRDVLVRGLSLSVAGSYWNSSGESFRTVTGELAYRPDATLRLAIGSGYDLFRYDVFDARERVHVRSYHVRLERRLGEDVRLDAGYELQRDDLDEFHLFRVGMTWTF